MKRQLGLESHHLRGLVNIAVHACLTLMCVLAVVIASHKAGKPSKPRSTLITHQPIKPSGGPAHREPRLTRPKNP